MSKTISCRDLGVACDFVARGATVETVLQACAAHGKDAHGMVELSPELAEKVQAAIRDEQQHETLLSEKARTT